MREWFFDTRSTGALTFIRLLLITVASVLVFHALSFTESADQAVQQSFSNEANMNMYSVLDTLQDPDEFSSFRDSSESVNSVGRFYNQLNSSHAFTFLSVFDQQVPTRNFKGGDDFNAYESLSNLSTDPTTGEEIRNIKSFQLNQRAFDFYHLQVSEGSAPNWSQIDYSTGHIPVLLGQGYRDLYRLGDTLHGNLYFRPMQFEVVGFLEEATSIYYRGNMNTFLDKSLVIPYPPHLDDIPKNSDGFHGILYFAMIGGDLAVPQDTSSDKLLAELQRVSIRAGFDQYTLLGSPSYLVQLQLMRTLILENRALVAGVVVVAILVLSVIVATLGRITLQRRLAAYRALHRAGYSRTSLQRIHLARQMSEGLCAVTIAFALGCGLPNANISSLIGAVGLVTLTVGLDLTIQRRQLSKSL